jgi:hypothetical protein
MKQFFISIILTLGFGTAFAKSTETYNCTRSGVAPRKVEINYLADSKKVPCDVVYTKDGVAKTLWDAKVQEGYCQEKAQEFVEKQKSEGWKCEIETAAQSTPAQPSTEAVGEPAPASQVESPANQPQ